MDLDLGIVFQLLANQSGSLKIRWTFFQRLLQIPCGCALPYSVEEVTREKPVVRR